jgi:chitinase
LYHLVDFVYTKMASLARVHRLSVLNILLLSLFSLNLNTVLAQARNNGTSDPQMNRLAQVKASRDGQQSDFTCGPNKECINGACCGEDGWCGYGPNYCGDGCQSNCDAKAECGQFAADPGQTCPLNVCCSQHGFCGTTSEFCDEGCQSNCEDPSPGGSPSNPRDIIIGYWEAWNMDKPCGTMGPGSIPVHMLTHLFVSFGYINSNWEVTNMDGVDPEIFKTIGNVKARNPDLKVVIALGGWTFSDPGPWQAIFPTMAGSQENRATFIRNLMGFMSEYGYDGVGRFPILGPGVIQTFY